MVMNGDSWLFVTLPSGSQASLDYMEMFSLGGLNIGGFTNKKRETLGTQHPDITGYKSPTNEKWESPMKTENFNHVGAPFYNIIPSEPLGMVFWSFGIGCATSISCWVEILDDHPTNISVGPWWHGVSSGFSPLKKNLYTWRNQAILDRSC